MKSSFARSLAPTLLCLFALASASFAATNPLNGPNGLAIDSSGNLYVANSLGSNILVFNPSYAQVKADTITAAIATPTGIAIDPKGNLWVANYAASNGGSQGSITKYTKGKQDDGAITSGISFPEALAIDGAGNIWVENGHNYINVYAQPVLSNQGVPTLAQTFGLTGPIYGMAVSNGTIGWGTASNVYFGSSTLALASGSTEGLEALTEAEGDTGLSIATDASGDFYMGNFDNTVYISRPNQLPALFVQLAFAPAGIAVDNVRGRVYLSNYAGNSISVYSTAGVLLKVIE
ncbi:MAG: hypothetical protein WAL71_10900 [Terriglobales bacterium]|jgi:DNA-binding beta-propeller fold protein YncE